MGESNMVSGKCQKCGEDSDDIVRGFCRVSCEIVFLRTALAEARKERDAVILVGQQASAQCNEALADLAAVQARIKELREALKLTKWFKGESCACGVDNPDDVCVIHATIAKVLTTPDSSEALDRMLREREIKTLESVAYIFKPSDTDRIIEERRRTLIEVAGYCENEAHRLRSKQGDSRRGRGRRESHILHEDGEAQSRLSMPGRAV